MMRKYLLLMSAALAVSIPAVPAVAQDKPAANQGKPQAGKGKDQAELDEAMKVIQNHLGAEREQLNKAVEKLLGRPDESTPRLFDCFADKSKSKDSRMLCVRVLQKVGRVSGTSRQKLLSIMRDGSDHPLPRIDAATMLLEDRASLGGPVINEIKQLGFTLYREGSYKDYVVSRILNRFPNDAEIEQFMVTAAKTEPDKSRRDGLLHILGKRKNKTIVGMIRSELKSAKPEKLFSKARMYLALGDVGTQESFDLLVEQLPREKDATQHSQILMAMGVTKNPGAKDILIADLNKPWRINTWAAVEGLRFLGDPTVIAVLEKELVRDVPAPSYKDDVRKAIERIKSGDDKPFW